MDKYLEAEKKLAELLGWTNLLTVTGIPPCESMHRIIPAWCRSWSVCGPLMVEHEIPIVPCGSRIAVSSIKGLQGHDIADHPDKDTATRYAIVQAVIAKLESEKED